MEKRSLQRIILFLLFILILSPCIKAQNITELRPIRLAWNGDEYSFYYEVTIVTDDAEGNRTVLQDYIKESMVYVSLPPGKYRCRVVPYDFLEKPGQGSQWMSFEVLSAIIPEPPLISLVEEPEYEEPEYIEEIWETGPVETVIIIDPEEAEIHWDAPPPPVVVKNRSFSLYIGAAWMPLLAIYGEKAPFFDKDLTLTGAGAQFGFLYSALNFLKPGFELTGSWGAYEKHAFTAGLNLVAQKDLPGPMALRFQLGAGVTVFESDFNLYSLLGLSLLFYPHPHFYIEAGFNYVHIFTNKAPGEHPGCLRPMAGLGWQL